MVSVLQLGCEIPNVIQPEGFSYQSLIRYTDILTTSYVILSQEEKMGMELLCNRLRLYWQNEFEKTVGIINLEQQSTLQATNRKEERRLWDLLRLGWAYHVKEYDNNNNNKRRSMTLVRLGLIRVKMMRELQLEAARYENNILKNCKYTEESVVATATGSTNPTSDYDISYLAQADTLRAYRIPHLTFFTFFVVWGVTTSHAFDTNLYAPSWGFFIPNDDRSIMTQYDNILSLFDINDNNNNNNNNKQTEKKVIPALKSYKQRKSCPNQNFEIRIVPDLTLTGIYSVRVPLFPRPLLIFVTDAAFFRQQFHFLMAKVTTINGFWSLYQKQQQQCNPTTTQLVRQWLLQGLTLRKELNQEHSSSFSSFSSVDDNTKEIIRMYLRRYEACEEMRNAYLKWYKSPALYPDEFRLACLRINFFSVEAYACCSTIYHIVLEKELKPRGLRLNVFDYALSWIENWVDLLTHLQIAEANERRLFSQHSLSNSNTNSDAVVLKTSKYTARILDAFEKMALQCECSKYLSTRILACLKKKTVTESVERVTNIRAGRIPYDAKALQTLMHTFVSECSNAFQSTVHQPLNNYIQQLLPIFASHFAFVVEVLLA